MYHPPSQRKQIIQRVITYSLMSIAVVGLVVVLVFIILGYQFNRADGRIEQGGLVQFNTLPAGATVSIDGAGFGIRTPSKTTLTAGQHFITMQREGYRTWQKSVSVVSGGVLWLSYARLVPNDLKPESVASLASIASTSVSPNSKSMAIKENSADAKVILADISGDEVKTSTHEMPAESFTRPTDGKTQRFTFDKWDPSSRYIITKHDYDNDKSEWLIVDSQNVANTKNITKLLHINASKIVFSGNNTKVLYALVDKDVRRIDIGAETLSRPLVANVADFSLYKDTTIVFTTFVDTETKKRSIGYYDESADTVRTMRSYEDDGTAPLKLALGNYFNETYFAIGYSDTIDVLKGDFSNPDKLSQVTNMPITSGIDNLEIVSEGRFVVAQYGNNYSVHDLELKKTTNTELQAGEMTSANKLRWLDNYTLWGDHGGKLRLYEFDGANQQTIMPIESGFNATLNPNGKYLYGIAKVDDGTYRLQRVRMVLP